MAYIPLVPKNASAFARSARFACAGVPHFRCRTRLRHFQDFPSLIKATFIRRSWPVVTRTTDIHIRGSAKDLTGFTALRGFTDVDVGSDWAMRPPPIKIAALESENGGDKCIRV